MKAKIFAKLKQEYSPLGLGDEILLAKAESLAATGLVTDENVDAVVAVQKRELENLQKMNDKRVGDALEKERNKHVADLKEQEKKVREAVESEFAEKAEKEKAAKQAEEEAKRAKAEKEASEAEAAKEKAKEEQKLAELEKSGAISEEVAKLLKKERKDADEREKLYAERFKQMQEDAAKAEQERQNQLAEMRKSFEALVDANKSMKESYDALVAENETAKKETAKRQREDFIKSKALELGVPQWRIDEGFSLTEEADEPAIVNALQQVANNIKTQLLPGNKQMQVLGEEKPTNTDIADLAKLIVK